MADEAIRAQRVLEANRALGAAQDEAYWADLIEAEAGTGNLPRRMVSGALGATRALAARRAGPEQVGRPQAVPIEKARDRHEYDSWATAAQRGAVPLAPTPPGTSASTPLHLAFAILPFGFGSGGHEVVFRLVERLESAGHACSLWLHDPFGEAAATPESVLRRQISEGFGVSIQGPLFRGFDSWHGADVAVATGWQTVWPLLGLGETRARAYLVNDDEPEFYPTSLESELAERTYAESLFMIAGTDWMLERLGHRHEVTGGSFDYTPSPDFRPQPIERREDTIVLYARTVTHRRAVGLAVMAIEELVRRREGKLRILMFGDRYPLPAPFDYEFLGLIGPRQLSWTYSEATVGVALSMTNASLAPLDMMACGLPCVDLAGGSSESVYGDEAGVEYSAFDPISLANAIEGLLDDSGRRLRRSQAGLDFVAGRSWEKAASQVEGLLRRSLQLREDG